MVPMKQRWHYYEAHINLGDMTSFEEKALPMLLDVLGFKTTDIVNVPIDGLEQEDFHTIITTKGENLAEITTRVRASVELLKLSGYKVNRYKIESTIIDSKYEDKWELL